MTLRIYGAGMAGLLAANMLRRYRPIIHEAAPELPDNHGAILRFRSDAVSRATGIPFRKVRVQKAVRTYAGLSDRATIADANKYSLKVTGAISARSILDLSPVERWIAPDNFLDLLARDCIIKTSHPLTANVLADMQGADDKQQVAISTVPMPVLMDMVDWNLGEPPPFQWQSIWSVTADIIGVPVDVYQTIYYPEPQIPYYRASITGKRLIIESRAMDFEAHDWIQGILRDFGIPSGFDSVNYEYLDHKYQEYGKLLPMTNDGLRRSFIMAMTDQYNLYSLGRFGTWRQILLDDVVTDVTKIDAMISERSAYARRLSGFARA
jgi:hypothetical protein